MEQLKQKYSSALKISKEGGAYILGVRRYGILNELFLDILGQNKESRAYQYLTKNYLPEEEYKLPYNGETVRVQLVKTVEYIRYKEVYHYLTDALNKDKGVDFFSWIAQHTTYIEKEDTLLGDATFNNEVQLISQQEVLELVDIFPHIQMTGYPLVVTLTTLPGVVEKIEELGWKVDKKYHIKGTKGFYLPYEVEVVPDKLFEWVDSFRTQGVEIERLNNVMRVKVKSKLGFDEYIKEWVKVTESIELEQQYKGLFEVGKRYEVNYKGTNIVIEHTWIKKNKQFADYINKMNLRYNLLWVTDEEYDAAVFYELLKLVHETEEGIVVEPTLYESLGIIKEELTSGMYEQVENVYSYSKNAYGEVTPIKVNILGRDVITEYLQIKDNYFTHDIYPEYVPVEDVKVTKRVEKEIINPSPPIRIKRLVNYNKLDYTFVNESLEQQRVKAKKDYTFKGETYKERVENIPTVEMYSVEGESSMVHYKDRRMYDYDKDDPHIINKVLLETRRKTLKEEEIIVTNIVLAVFENKPVESKGINNLNKRKWGLYINVLIDKALDYYYLGKGYTELRKMMYGYPKSEEE